MLATHGRTTPAPRAHACRTSHNAVLAKGSFKNFNTIEDFKNADKAALFNHLSDDVHTLVRAFFHAPRYMPALYILCRAPSRLADVLSGRFGRG